MWKKSSRLQIITISLKLTLIDKKQKVVINYLLTSQDNSWKIFDVLLDGTISEIATKKSEFRNFINNGDIANLINALRVKTNIIEIR